MAAGARKRGVRIETHSRVVGIDVRAGRVRGVRVVKDGQERTIAADVVVNAGGMFAPEIGRLAGVDVPIVPMAHEYLFTERIDGVSPTLPTMRDPDNLVYFREEVGGLCMGGYERHPAPWSLDGIPADFNGKLLAPDWPRFAEIMDGAVRRVPAIGDAGVNRMINGPEAFTPDNEFILGESEVRGFFVAAGFCAHGIAGAGGIGRQVASWIVDGEPELDLWKMDIRRFGAQYRSQAYTLARTVEVYSTYYDIHYPNEERRAGRPLRLSPTYETAGRAGCGLRREVRLGAAELVRVERPGRRRRAPAARLGRPALVAGDRRGGTRDADRRRVVRRVELQQDRDRRTRRLRLPAAAVRQRHRPAGRLDRVHPDAQPARRDRGRLHRHPAGRRSLPDRDRDRVRQPRPRLDPQAARRAWARRRRGHRRGSDQRLGLLRAVGPAGARHPGRLHPDDVSDAGFPYLTARRITIGNAPSWPSG